MCVCVCVREREREREREGERVDSEVQRWLLTMEVMKEL